MLLIHRRRSGIDHLLALLLALLTIACLHAADAQAPVTYDDVNAVAARMYCPECENIPLDKCFTEVCVQWKQDIADQLQAGRDADAIITDFVARFGDQVVGVPQDSLLRTVTLAAPWLLVGVIACAGLYTLYRLRRHEPVAAAPAVPDATLDQYRARLERDLND